MNEILQVSDDDKYRKHYFILGKVYADGPMWDALGKKAAVEKRKIRKWKKSY